MTSDERLALDEMTRRAREAEAAAAVLRLHLARVANLLDSAGGEGVAQICVQRAHWVASVVASEHDAGRAFLRQLARLESQVAAQACAGAAEARGDTAHCLQLLAFAIARGADQGEMSVSAQTLAELCYEVWLGFDEVEGVTRVSVARK